MSAPHYQEGYAIGMTVFPLNGIAHEFPLIAIGPYGIYQNGSTYSDGSEVIIIGPPGPPLELPMYARRDDFIMLSEWIDNAFIYPYLGGPNVADMYVNWGPFQTIEMEIIFSSLTREGNYNIANPDGSIKVWTGETKIIDVSGLMLNDTRRYFHISAVGYMASLYIRAIPERFPGYAKVYTDLYVTDSDNPDVDYGPPEIFGGLAPVSLPTDDMTEFAMNFQGKTDEEIFEMFNQGGYWTKRLWDQYDEDIPPSNLFQMLNGMIHMPGGNGIWAQLYRPHPILAPKNLITAGEGGLYELVPGKRNDTVFTEIHTEETVDKPIPAPYIKTALIGS